MSQPPEPRYFIAQGENVQGPFTRSRVMDLVRQGKVTADMMFSLEGGEWVQGHQIPDLFPQTSGAAPAPLAGYSDAQGHTPPPPTAPRPGDGHGSGRAGSGRGGRGPRGGGRRVRPHRGAMILVFGILGIVCCFIFGIMAWVMGNDDLRKMKNGHMDRSGEGLTQAGKILGIVSIAWNVLLLLVAMGGGLGGSRSFNY